MHICICTVTYRCEYAFRNTHAHHTKKQKRQIGQMFIVKPPESRGETRNNIRKQTYNYDNPRYAS